MDYSEGALNALKKKGYRITKPRRLVIDLLDQSKVALSAYEIRELLQGQGEEIDQVSVYRILECLEENNLLHRVLMTGKVRKCEIDEDGPCHRDQLDHCHHLLICKNCNAINEVHCVGLTSLAQQVTEEAGFWIEDHRLEFIGLCKQCHD